MSENSGYFVPVGELSRQGRFVRGTVKTVVRPAFAAADYPWVQRGLLKLMNGISRLPKGTIIRKENILGLPCEWIASSEAAMDDPRTILYLHGGGFVCGGADSHREFAAHIAKGAGVRVLLPEYRLAPENPFPCANDDCLGMYRWLLRHGVPAEQIVIGGDSAGGCLAAMTLISARDAGDPVPAAAVMFSPATDCLEFDGESYVTRKDADPWFSPVVIRKLVAHYAVANHPRISILAPLRRPLNDLPPLYIQVGDAEVLQSDSVRFAERAKEAGTQVTLEVWEHMWHDFPMFAGLMPESREALARVTAFVKERLGA